MMKPDAGDLLIVLGVGLVLWGLYLIWPPLALIVGGLGLIGMGAVRFRVRMGGSPFDRLRGRS